MIYMTFYLGALIAIVLAFAAAGALAIVQGAGDWPR